MEDFRARDTRTSPQKSGSSGFVGQEETSNLGSRLTEPLPTEWTDEKHHLYLKSMEASFVSQLYNSVDFLGWHLQEEKVPDPQSSWQMHLDTHTSSGQFKVLQGAIWQKIKFDKTEPQPQPAKANGSHVLLANPWVRHFRSSCQKVEISPALQDSSGPKSQAINIRGKKALSSRKINSKHLPVGCLHTRRQDSVGCYTEVSDQNFIGEDIEGEKLGSAKRMKAIVADASSDDQVVPLGKSLVTEDLAENCVSPGRKRLHSSDH